MIKKITYYIVLLTFLVSGVLKAQVFPVNVTPQVIPPYSLKLSEYSTSVSDKLILNLLLTDITEANRQVRLKLYIENNAGLSIQSNDVVIGATPIFLDGGVPLRIGTIDLQPYFALQNLVGITPQQYSRPLQEGLYGFCFEVYDALSGRQISRKSCARVYLALANPPILITPERNEMVVMKNPQNIFFNWSPGTPAGTRVEYEFTLKELWDTQIDPQAAFLSSPPLFQTTTSNNSLLYGPGETQLLPNKMYGWRVKAIATDGINETSVFKNNGYSEIYHFIYSDVCKEPEFVLAEARNPTSEKILWQGVDHDNFKVQYRKKDAESIIWFDVQTVNQYTHIYNLEPGTTYQFRVGGECIANGGYTYSQIYEFTTILSTRETATYNCGITPEIVITNQEPIETMVVNDVFTAGDFPVTVKEVISGNTTVSNNPLDDVQQGTGLYSGWGYIVVPYLEDTKLKVSFNGIGINTDYQLISGIVVTDYDENWGGVVDIGNTIDALLSLADAILQALNLDISSDTKDQIDQIINSIVDQIDEESLPNEIKEDIKNAATDMQEASDSYSQAQEVYENENSTDEEKEDAKQEMEAAESDFKEAQDKLDDANREAEKFKKDVADLLKKAIYEIYREGKDRESTYQNDYQKELSKFNYGEEPADQDSVVAFEGGFVDTEYTELDSAFVTLERDFSSYLFSRMLNGGDETLLNNFIDISKKIGFVYIDIVKKGREENKEENAIVDELIEALKQSFLEILLQSNFAE
ncbi:fibronectin type III domain-containing protein [Aquimarina sp. 2201CG1-2-11]|uniref:fibronectin type III domain-containing protein n=1 Tax=Aquimarina discodermiae TaxID=3231043 RepID=UPI0034618460